MSERSGALSRSEELDLYARLIEGDPTAPSDLAVTYLDRLTEWLIRHNPGVDPHDCATAAEDAILALIKNPRSYKSERQTLEVYLRISALGDLRNRLRSEQRHRERRVPLDVVELSPDARKYLWDVVGDPALIVEKLEDVDLATIRANLQVALTEEENRVLELMTQGERRTEAYAAVLGITHRPVSEQRRVVKRVKDRIKKRLERAGGWSE